MVELTASSVVATLASKLTSRSENISVVYYTVELTASSVAATFASKFCTLNENISVVYCMVTASSVVATFASKLTASVRSSQLCIIR